MSFEFIVANIVLSCLAGCGIAYICFKAFVAKFMIGLALAYQEDMEEMLVQLQADFLANLESLNKK